MRPGGDHRERRARCGTPAPMPIARIPVPLAVQDGVPGRRGEKNRALQFGAFRRPINGPTEPAVPERHHRVRAWLDDTTATRQSPDGTGRPPARAPMREKTAARLLDVAGHPHPGLHYAGPLWRAQHWEMTAVPELRRGVGATAAAIAAQLARPRNESLPAAV